MGYGKEFFESLAGGNNSFIYIRQSHNYPSLLNSKELSFERIK